MQVWCEIMVSTEYVLFYEFSVVGKYWFTGVLRDLDMGLKLLFWCYKLDFSVDFDKSLIFKGLSGFLDWLVVIFDDVKSGEMVDFIEFCRSGYRSKNGKNVRCGVCGKCMWRVWDVWVEHMTMILKIGIIPKM